MDGLMDGGKKKHVQDPRISLKGRLELEWGHERRQKEKHGGRFYSKRPGNNGRKRESNKKLNIPAKFPGECEKMKGDLRRKI